MCKNLRPVSNTNAWGLLAILLKNLHINLVTYEVCHNFSACARMVDFKCVVPGCKNTYKKAASNLKFHQFPKEAVKRGEWKAALKIGE